VGGVDRLELRRADPVGRNEPPVVAGLGHLIGTDQVRLDGQRLRRLARRWLAEFGVDGHDVLALIGHPLSIDN
jgi:hypothetical protein